MSNGSKPRSLSEIEDLAVVRQVVYRLAIIDALRELRPHDCLACRRAESILESVDRPRPAPTTVDLPAPRQPPPEPVAEDMVMTTFDVACAFRVDPRAVDRWVKTGKIPPEAVFHDAKGRRRFHTGIIDKLLD